MSDPRQPRPASSRSTPLKLFNNVLRSLPRLERNAVLAFIPYWLDLPGESRAAIAKITRPELSEADIATLAGVTPRTLRRWERYKRARPTPADFKRIKRQPSKRRASNTGGWWALDNPDRDYSAEMAEFSAVE